MRQRNAKINKEKLGRGMQNKQRKMRQRNAKLKKEK